MMELYTGYGLGASHHHHVTNQAIASMPSTPRPTGAEGRGKKKKKRGYTVCSSGYAATDTS
jgi:hypothetical protein